MKNTFVLNVRDFRPALVKGSKTQRLQQKLQSDRETWLKGNAVQLLKQAVRYADEADTKLIALFDWKSLFLCEFAEVDDEGLGLCVEGTFHEEAEGDKSRKALSGFLLTAYKATKKDDEGA